MIEKFSMEELEIIRNELKLTRSVGSKQFVLSEQRSRLASILDNCEESNHGMTPFRDITAAMNVLCDYATRNINKLQDDKWMRYQSILCKEKYCKMFDELIDLFEKYRN